MFCIDGYLHAVVDEGLGPNNFRSADHEKEGTSRTITDGVIGGVKSYAHDALPSTSVSDTTSRPHSPITVLSETGAVIKLWEFQAGSIDAVGNIST